MFVMLSYKTLLPELFRSIIFILRFIWGLCVKVFHAIFFLILLYSEGLIGRKGPTTWPDRSPDLNPLGLISWDLQRVLFMLQKAMTFTTSKKGYIMDVRRFIRRLGFCSECESQCTDVDLPALKKRWALLIIFLNLQETLCCQTSYTAHAFIKEEKRKRYISAFKICLMSTYNTFRPYVTIIGYSYLHK
jgi:hypothetical protein